MKYWCNQNNLAGSTLCGVERFLCLQTTNRDGIWRGQCCTCCLQSEHGMGVCVCDTHEVCSDSRHVELLKPSLQQTCKKNNHVVPCPSFWHLNYQPLIMSKLASLMSNYTLIQKVIKGNVISDTQAVSLLKLQHGAIPPALIAVITISSKAPILSNNPQNRSSDSVNILAVLRRANWVRENRLKRWNIPVSAHWIW